MKRLHCYLLMGLSTSILAQDIPYGIEFVAGLRSGYNQKGLNLADDLVDIQLQSNITLTKSTALNIALWQGAEINGNFQEFGILCSGTKTYDGFSLTGEIGYTHYESNHISSGTEASIGFDYELAYPDLILYSSLGYNTGAGSFFALLGLTGSHRLTDDSYLGAKVELYAADSYFNRSGLYNMSSRLTYTQNISEFLSVSPFTSISIPLDDENLDLSSGVWVEVFF